MTNQLIIWQSEEVAAPAVEAQAMKSMALEAVEGITAITTDAENEHAVALIGDVSQLIKEIEKAHKLAKERPLRLCQALDKCKNEFLASLKAEELRVNTLAGNFIQDKLEVQREAERARQRELDRIEAERLAEERRIEQERINAEAARIAELRRVEAEVEAKRAAEQAKLDAEANAAKSKKAKAEAAAKQVAFEAEQARLRKEREAAALVETERAAAEQVMAEAGRADREAMAAQEMAAVPEVAPLEKAVGQTIKPTMCFEVTDIYKLFRARPNLCKIEPIKSAINEVLALGVKDIPGLRVWEEVKTGVRLSKGPKFLDV